MGILVVEDEGLIANNLADGLRRGGYEITGIAESGEDALEKASTLKPDLVLMDIHLSGKMDGIEAAEKVRSEFSIPVIFLTAHANPEVLNRAKLTYPFGYLVKPIRQVDLISAVEIALYKHQMERKLKQREAWLATTLRCAGDGVVVTDAGGRIEFLNDLSKRILGIQDRNVIGERFFEVVRLKNRFTGASPGDLVRLAILQGDTMSIGSDLILAGASDQAADIEGDIALSEIDGSIVGTVFTFRDVTVRNYREENRRQDLGTRACARLADAVSTELRAFLQTSVEGSERSLPSDPPPGLARHAVATRSLSRMADQLDLVGRRAASYPRSLNLNALIAEVCGELGPDLPANIVLTSHLQPDVDPAYADPIQMKQAIVSLIRHSQESMPTGGAIDIVTRNYGFERRGPNGRPESYVRLTVGNTSPKIAVEAANRLFDPAVASVPPANQWDLRLFHVHGMISDAGGSIRAKATPSQGMSFEILLPRFDDKEARIPSSAAPFSQPQWEQACIMVIHTDHAVRGLVLDALERAGYDAIGARDSGEALEWTALYPGSIALLITDLDLGDMSGLALADRIAVRHPGIRVVFTVDYAADPAVKKALMEHGARLLENPFRLEELLGQVEESLAEGEPAAPEPEGVTTPSVPRETSETTFRQDSREFHVEARPTAPEADRRHLAPAVREMSGRKLAEDQFRHSDEIFHLMVNNIKDYGIIMLDPKGCVVTWNAGSQAISGYQADEVVGRHFSLFYPSSDVEQGKPEVELATASSTGRSVVEGWRLRKDGTAFWADVVVTALRDHSGELLGFAKVTRDMSERKRAEALDSAKTSDLIAANKELEAFAYSVSHDLRAPLRHLDGFAELLRKNWYQRMDALGQRYLDRITASAQRMGRLIDDLLAFSRLLRADVSRTHVSLRLLQEEVRRGLEPDLAGRTVVWTIGDLPDVYGDRSMLRQVFVNLLSNAVKFTRDRPEARIEIGCAGSVEEEATIFVRDNGAGFEMQYVGKLFEVFQRLHSDEFEGTGVGLANVRRIVERHGGRVWAEGAVDQGATFYFTLRLNRETDHA